MSVKFVSDTPRQLAYIVYISMYKYENSRCGSFEFALSACVYIQTMAELARQTAGVFSLNWPREDGVNLASG